MSDLFLGYKILKRKRNSDVYCSPMIPGPGQTWIVGEVVKAFCYFQIKHYEDAPLLRCSCGIYLQKEKRYLTGAFIPNFWRDLAGDMYLARCVAWGNIIEGEQGFRCEYVRAESITPIAGICWECDKEFQEGYVVFYPLQIHSQGVGLCSGHFKELGSRESRFLFLKIPEPEVLQVQSFWRK